MLQCNHDKSNLEVSDIWTRRAKVFLELFAEICAIEKWELSTDVLRKNGSFAGLRVWYNAAKQQGTKINPQLTNMLETLPGVKPLGDGPVELNRHGIISATEQHDMYCLQIAIALLEQRTAQAQGDAKKRNL